MMVANPFGLNVSVTRLATKQSRRNILISMIDRSGDGVEYIAVPDGTYILIKVWRGGSVVWSDFMRIGMIKKMKKIPIVVC